LEGGRASFVEAALHCMIPGGGAGLGEMGVPAARTSAQSLRRPRHPRTFHASPSRSRSRIWCSRRDSSGHSTTIRPIRGPTRPRSGFEPSPSRRRGPAGDRSDSGRCWPVVAIGLGRFLGAARDSGRPSPLRQGCNPQPRQARYAGAPLIHATVLELTEPPTGLKPVGSTVGSKPD
jgi:hypothetical protein